MRLRLGLRYDLRLPPARLGEVPRLYERVLEHAEAADASAVQVVWVAERPFAAGAVFPAALPLCSALASRTRRLRVGTAALPLPLHHPLRVAEDAATLDALSGGRLELGVGLGGHAEGFHGFGVPPAERGARFAEGVELLRRAWSDGPLHFAGRHFSFAGEIEVWPKPLQRPGPPLWIAAAGDMGLRRAARLGDGLLAGSSSVAARFAAACLAEGRSPAALRVAFELPGLAGPPELAVRAASAALEALGADFGGVDLVVPVLAQPAPGDAPALGLEPAALERLSSQTWHAVEEVASRGASSGAR
jgi:alkanesulfonate monooxygenase SsuD/methylene tetrahydromethanopterin reductase-like flavin-dependent oxidoreductase (luciferase family)